MMPTLKFCRQIILAIFLFIAFSFWISGQGRRAMTLEDLMNFKNMGVTVLSESGKWLAYEVKVERNDGYGVLVTTDKTKEHRVERAEKPVFSFDSRWAVFLQVPPFAETEKKPANDKLKNNAVLINLVNGKQTIFYNVKQVKFSNNAKYLFIHHDLITDTLWTKGQTEKLKKAATKLSIITLENLSEKSVHFVDTWTIDSLSKYLVYSLKDTLKTNKGLNLVKLSDDAMPSIVIDTIGKSKFGSFSWYEKQSILAYMKAEDSEKINKETAELYKWNVDKDQPMRLVSQSDAPQSLYLPYDNELTWTTDGRKLFFGFRQSKYSEVKQENPKFESIVDSLQSLAEVDVWHVSDPRIKSNEKATWNQMRKQNMLAVIHMIDNRIIQLADENLPTVQPSMNSIFVAGFTSVPYSVKATWDGNYRDFYGINTNTGERTLISKELSDLASVSPTKHYALYFKEGNWHSINLISGSVRYLTYNLGVNFFDENNDTPSEPSSYRMMGWLDDGVSVILYDKYDIWLANLEYGEIKNITEGEGRKNNIILRIKKLDSKPLFSLKDEVLIEGFNEKTKEKSLYKAKLSSQGIKLLKDDKKNLKWLHSSIDLKTFIYSRESYNEYPDLWASDMKFKNPVRLSDLNKQLDSFAWGKSELVDFKNADGVPLQGVLIKPGNFDSSKRYPVFVYYYEKFSQRLHEFNQTVINHRPGFGYYASNGYCVFLPDIHFEVGYPGNSAVKSLVPGVQKLIDMGVADKNAIGLHGHSWSGYQTAFVVTQTDIFKAAIAGAPVSNMTSAYSGIRWGTGLARQFQYEKGQSRIGPSMFENLDLYIQNSPVFFAENIKTPLLLMHGDKDEAVPWEQSIELYLAMRRLGKDVIFLQYRNEPHHPQKYPNKVDYTIRMKEYFDYHLKGMEPAEWITKGRPYPGN